MGMILGTKLPQAIYDYFKHNSMTGIASTIDEDAFPRGAPISLFYAPSDQFMLMAVQNKSQTYHNACRTGKICLTFVGKESFVFSLQGRVVQLKDTMSSNKHMAILAIKIKEVKSNEAIDVIVVEGIVTEFRSERWQQHLERLLGELRSCTLQDIQEAALEKIGEGS